MQCPVCDHQAAAADFGEPLRCPNCRAFYEKAVIAQALKADSGSSPKQPTAPVAGVWSDQGRIVSWQSKITRWIGMSVSALIGISFYVLVAVDSGGAAKSQQEHIAPIAAGAIPERIGCEEGCDESNKYERWHPYLRKVAEIHRRNEKCQEVEYVSVSTTDGTPDNPVFFVMCADKNDKQFNSFYTKSEVDSGRVKKVINVTNASAYSRCREALDKRFPRVGQGKFAQGIHIYPDGNARVMYDFAFDGVTHQVNCYASHSSVDFEVIR
jgi:hypothetical protein